MLVFRVQNSIFFKVFFPGHLLSLSDLNCRLLRLPESSFSHGMFAKIDLSWKSFLKNSGMDFSCACGAMGAVLLTFLGLENKLENRTMFYEIQNLKTWIWVRRSVGLWAL